MPAPATAAAAAGAVLPAAGCQRHLLHPKLQLTAASAALAPQDGELVMPAVDITTMSNHTP